MRDEAGLTVGLARGEVVDGSVLEGEGRESTRSREPLLEGPSSDAEHKERQESEHGGGTW